MKLYVASSWRNSDQPDVVRLLRGAGHEVYDFRHPPGGDHLGFSWSDTLDDPNELPWQEWDADRYLAALRSPIAHAGFASDFGAMQWADAGVLVLPCGRSAHLEAGWMLGAGKPVWILLDEIGGLVSPANGFANPELMYLVAGVDKLVRSIDELIEAIPDEIGDLILYEGDVEVAS